jgi:PAS domain S-box-containing protein
MNIPDHLAQTILSTESDAILIADRDGVIRFWNAGAVSIFGFASAEAIGQSLDLIIPEALRARHWEGYRRVMVDGNTRYGSGDVLAVPAMSKDGRRISVEFTIIILRDDGGGLTGVGAILRDVTARFEEVRTLKRRVSDLETSSKDQAITNLQPKPT